ncbi:hypothetical protein [Acinetobacter phage vB_AbaS_Ftm]
MTFLSIQNRLVNVNHLTVLCYINRVTSRRLFTVKYRTSAFKSSSLVASPSYGTPPKTNYPTQKYSH